MWGKKVLDEDAFAEQEAQAAKAANPWGPMLDIPAPKADEAAADDDVTDAPDAGDSKPPTLDLGMSVATVEQQLGEDPESWLALLDMELNRNGGPRKTALRAILRTGREEKGDEDVLASIEAVIVDLSKDSE